MPVTHISKVFAVEDCKLRPLLSDTEGGTTEYGDWIDVPGIKTVAIRGNVETKSLRGDNMQLDADSVITELTVAITYAKLSLDVLAMLTGSAVVDAGTTGDQTAFWDLLGGAKPKPFALEAVSVSADPVMGNVGFELTNVKLNAFPELGLAEEDYNTHTTGGVASPRLSDKRWLRVGIYETAHVIGAPAA